MYTSNVIEIANASFSPQSFPSAHTEPFAPDAIFRKRKIERACDTCRRRKTKCDGPRMPNNVCTSCIQNRKICSYVEVSKPRGPPKAYITGLEDRLERMEALLKRLRPEADFSEELGPPVIRDSWKEDPELPCRVLPQEESSSPSGFLQSAAPRSSRSAGTPRSDTDFSSDGYTSTDSEEVGELSLSRGMKRLTMRGLEPTQDHCRLADNQVRFHGKSSCFKLIEPTRKLRDEHVNRVTGGDDTSPSIHDSTSPTNAAASRRPEFWAAPPWELAFEGFQSRLENLSLSLSREFPPSDLADSLIRSFFENVNPFAPLFHRPTFERQWKGGLQHKDPWFGCLCLCLFAVASRWSDDPRVLDDSQYNVPQAEKPAEEHKWQRAGWKFFNAAVDVHRGSSSLFHPAGLFEVQTMALLGMFLRGTAFHPVAWIFISVGLRKAQDVGAHRKKIYGDKPSVEGELWKRAFWVLVLLDRISSASLGRPCCSGEEEFDAELPLEADDEYWETEDSEKAFQQPAGKPSKVAAFNSYLKLTKIVAYAMRTIYALDRSKLIFSAARPRWQEVLAQLNHAMTDWVDSVPKHLHWSPHIEDPLFASQSATLYITYYLIQIIIYRPFLPPSLHSVINITPHSHMPIPCIAICVNAGKCVSRILKAQISRGYANIPTLILGSHVCAAILLMNYWDLKWQERNQMRCDGFEDIKSPPALAMAELLEEISVFVEALEAVRPRWRSAEMYLSALAVGLSPREFRLTLFKRTDLSSSFPQSLGGYEPGTSKNDLVSQHRLSWFDDRAYRNVPPPNYTTLADRRNSSSDYRVFPLPPTDACAYDTQIEQSEGGPHFFEFPDITRCPVPNTLPISSYGRDQSMATGLPGFDGLYKTKELRDRKSSMSDIQRRPASLFDQRNLHETPTTQCRLYAMASRASCGGSDSVSVYPSSGGNFVPYQTIPGWASDWSHDLVSEPGSRSDNAAALPGHLSRDGVTSSHDQFLSLSGRY